MTAATSWLSEIFSGALAGHDAHCPPARVVQGLAHEQAARAGWEGGHSPWELLYHIVFWQELCLRAIAGRRVDWREAEAKGWPSEDMQATSPWEELCRRFDEGLQEADRLARTRDPQAALDGWGGAPAAKAFMVLVQHNSYHLAQIVDARRALGL